MRRREFLVVLTSAAALPLAAQAQQPERIRRIGVLMPLTTRDAHGQVRLAALLQGLRDLGWIDGSNVQVDIRWTAGRTDISSKYAAELVALAPDVVLAPGALAVRPFLQLAPAVPIVFVHVPDPVGAGFVTSLARPGGNATGFMIFEFGISGKWLELLKQIAPAVKRAAIIRDPTTSAGIGQFAAIQSVAPSLGIEVVPINVRAASELEHTLATFAHTPNGGLIVTGSGLAMLHRNSIVKLAARYKLPSVYWDRVLVDIGGLISYGADSPDQYRRAATYIDRILKGEKPADLPVQAPTKYELVINQKTAKALGLTVPPSLLARADEVIE